MDNIETSMSMISTHTGSTQGITFFLVYINNDSPGQRVYIIYNGYIIIFTQVI